MKYAYVEKNFQRSSLELIEMANRIIAKYQAAGYRMTLRQLYYQLVKANLIPNNMRTYKRLASILNDGRWAGLVDWSAIEDRVRNTVRVSTWNSPGHIIKSALDSYKENLWENQPVHLEVMSEKDAVSNIVEPICYEYQVPFTANRGYPSASLLYEVAARLYNASEDGKDIQIIYIGDHDPSGLDMDRDILERIELLAEGFYYPDFGRLALTMTQINDWGLPPNPAKTTDSRSSGYVEEFGNVSWELDSIDFDDLKELVQNEITEVIDWDLWKEASDKQAASKDKLRELLEGLE